MGKDREGKFHPRKGKPSGSFREGPAGLQPIDSSVLEENLHIADKYTVGEEQPAANVRVRHPNRNVDKREERQRNKAAQRSDNPSNKSVEETYTVEWDKTVAGEWPAALSKDQFAELGNYKADPCISVYMGTSTTTSVATNAEKDFIGYKNKLQQLTQLLREKNIEQTAIERLLKPGYDLLRDEQFWSKMGQGLAVFLSDGFFRYMKLPIAPRDEIMLNTSFYLTPLIPVMTSKDYFYLLVLSKKQAKLYRADEFGMQYIPVPGMPKGIEDVVHVEQKDDRNLFRTDAIGAGGGATYHGTGSSRPDEKANMAMYFDEVDETLWKEVLNKEKAPLLLAGVEYLIPIYKQVAEYKPIWDAALNGSLEHENTPTLYQQARQIMEPYFQERVTRALEVYANQSATELTSSIPEDVIAAAHYGRVSQLFVLKGEHIWGTFDEMNNQLTVHGSQEEGDECLVDKSIIKTLLSGGEVHILPEDKMPGRSKLAALMRY